jgi:hypothetical protein
VPSFVTLSDNRFTPDQCFSFVTDLTKWTTFTGYGPLPGIRHAEAADGRPLALGSVVRVQDSDGSSHEEVVTVFERPTTYAVTMRLTPPASWLMKRIDERVDFQAIPCGTRITRRFDVLPRSFLAWPLVWAVTFLLLRPAVRRHDAVVSRLAPP